MPAPMRNPCIYIVKVNIHSSCEIEDFVETIDGIIGGAGRGRGTRGGVVSRLEDGRGAPPGPNP